MYHLSSKWELRKFTISCRIRYMFATNPHVKFMIFSCQELTKNDQYPAIDTEKNTQCDGPANHPQK